MTKQAAYRDRRNRGRRIAHVEIEERGIPRLLAAVGYLDPAEIGDRHAVDRALGEMLEQLRLARLKQRDR